eukprot:g5639.t1
MPSIVRIHVGSARDLPVMDRTSKLTDAYVEVEVAGTEMRTAVCRKTLNPSWDEDFEVSVADDSRLQNDPVEFKVMDMDVYSADDPIGLVYVDLNPLLMRAGARETSQRDLVIEGWFPIYDTLKGVRGELSVRLKLQFIGDDNPFKESSAGVQFFGISSLCPVTYAVTRILGFVEELEVDDDPEFEWSDNFRTARKSNESRQLLFYRLSCNLRRQLGKKVLDLGGNAILGYQQHFDVEGDSGIVARGIGTACYIAPPTPMMMGGHGGGAATAAAAGMAAVAGASPPPPPPPPPLVMPLLPRETQMMSSAAGAYPYHLHHHRRSASGTPQLLGARGGAAGAHHAREVQLFTLSQLPGPMPVKLAGVVSATSVKYLGKLAAKISDRETRDGWWSEIREEIRTHARVLRCWSVIGYSERCTITGDVCVLTARGTAALIKRRGPRRGAGGGGGQQMMPDGSGASGGGGGGGGGGVSSFSGGVGRVDPSPGSSPAGYAMSGESPSAVAAPLSPLRSKSLTFNDTGTAAETVAVSAAGAVGAGPAASAAPVAGAGGTGRGQHYFGGRGDGSSRYRRGRRSGASAGKRLRRQQRRNVFLSSSCASCHVPYHHHDAPFANMRLVPCAICKKKWVPEVLLATCELPDNTDVVGAGGTLVQARVCRPRRKCGGEEACVVVSEALPFIQYDLHRQLMIKMKVLGLNAAFGLEAQVQVGEGAILALATATAVFLPALPAPPPVAVQYGLGSMMMAGRSQRIEEQLAR